MKSTAMGNFPELRAPCSLLLFLSLSAGSPHGSFWDFSFFTTVPMCGLHHLHTVYHPPATPQPVAPSAPPLPTPNSPGLVLTLCRNPCRSPDTRHSSGLRMPAPGCRGGVGLGGWLLTVPEFTYFFFFIFFFGFTTCIKKNSWRVRSVSKQSGPGS